MTTIESLTSDQSSSATPSVRGSPVRRSLWERFSTKLLLRNADFATKVRWHMENDRGTVVAALQDKVGAKAFADARGVSSAKLLHVTTDPATLRFDRLPADCFIKANHASGWNILRKGGEFYRFGNGQEVLGDDGELLPEQALASRMMTAAEAVKLCRRWLLSNYSVEESSYHTITPQIVVEELLHPAVPGEFKDYRFYTFDGRVRVINVGSPSYRRRQENVFFSPRWEEMLLTRYKEKRPDPLPVRPERLDEMVACAERLGSGINFVRIDLYDTSAGVAFGEFTFYPQAGDPDTPTGCPRFNRWLGACWRAQARA